MKNSAASSKTGFKSTSALKLLSGFFFLSASTAWSFVPPIANIIKHQPAALSNKRKSFQSTGRIALNGQTLSYKLTWFRRNDYLVEIQGVHSSFYKATHAASAQRWSLQRKNGQCLLQANRLNVPCPDARTWGSVELSGSPSVAAQALKEAGLISPSEMQARSVRREDYLNRSPARPRFAVGHDNSAVIEITGQASLAPSDKAIKIQYDQSFFAPAYLHTIEDGKAFTIVAEADLEIRKGRNRFTPIIAQQLKVFHQNHLIASITRSEAEWSRQKSSLPLARNTQMSLTTLSEQLSPSGQMLLHTLLVTH